MSSLVYSGRPGQNVMTFSQGYQTRYSLVFWWLKKHVKKNGQINYKIFIQGGSHATSIVSESLSDNAQQRQNT